MTSIVIEELPLIEEIEKTRDQHDPIGQNQYPDQRV